MRDFTKKADKIPTKVVSKQPKEYRAKSMQNDSKTNTANSQKILSKLLKISCQIIENIYRKSAKIPLKNAQITPIKR